LWPPGMGDVLAPDAGFEASVLARLMEWFSKRGYEHVAPPLIEFEDGLLTGIGAGLAEQTFRMMDPVSQRMMAVRADITPQIARIAQARLAKAPRPLRLCYAGHVLRVRGTQLRPERQFTQVGAELIGAAEPAADAEVIVMAAEALIDLGVRDLSCDLGLPTLVAAVSEDSPAGPEARARLRQALDRKDAAAVDELSADFGADTIRILSAMLAATGPAAETLDALGGLGLNPAAAAGRDLLADVTDRIRAMSPDLTMTVDPVENRGFEYHTGVTFTFFATGVRGELGNGGRYQANGTAEGGDGEPATGFTLFMDTVIRALPAPERADRVYVPAPTPVAEAAKLRAEGWITVSGLTETDEAKVEAARLGCGHVLADGEVQKLENKDKA
ncbi:MAG: ATP phosphoribosyltransferase regulatory subunit, partial [Proteobacteria bacterium]|nr:ATP phosphoribosyltransferase regulatory subunit [Pseudomonadota bacterium]